ncbi:DUF1707 domain-containing protein [Actinokineospora auranticolor]|uniref:Uncharacterized protein DUF1707 n=1 Tax=Actinokineospora auranticolor TaxID=155976 RepID=A0A2S6GWZ6_9PSEU|nr:DUF1707 domain-containing protein [Actinokineospora auranticolor]PPK69765.1 uncharacterized protein DUF1707 [Actinokineospora auranticolor]
MAQGEHDGIRISAAERDEAVTMLGAHMSTGRLEVEEYEFRTVRAAAARTRAEIESLFSDLPAPHPDLSGAARPNPSAALKSMLPSRPANSKGLVATPASEALDTLAGLLFVLGLPGAILLTIYLGMWWTIVGVVVGAITAGAIAEAVKKPA